MVEKLTSEALLENIGLFVILIRNGATCARGNSPKKSCTAVVSNYRSEFFNKFTYNFESRSVELWNNRETGEF